jgi:uncharacterized membrane protein HdeD (DUF308 family)
MSMPVEDLQGVRRRWWLFLGLGVLLVVLGLLALSEMVFVTLVWVTYFGFLLLFGGLSQIVSAFSSRVGSGFFLQLLVGVLDAIVGVLLIARPVQGALVLTALLGLSFLIGGLFRIGAAASLQYPRWGLSALSGAIAVLLGVIILRDWRDNWEWIIGLFVGIDLLSRGFSWIGIALGLRPARETFPQSA